VFRLHKQQQQQQQQEQQPKLLLFLLSEINQKSKDAVVVAV